MPVQQAAACEREPGDIRKIDYILSKKPRIFFEFRGLATTPQLIRIYAERNIWRVSIRFQYIWWLRLETGPMCLLHLHVSKTKESAYQKPICFSTYSVLCHIRALHFPASFASNDHKPHIQITGYTRAVGRRWWLYTMGPWDKFTQLSVPTK